MGRQQQQQQAAGDAMAQTAASPLRSILKFPWNWLTVSPRRHHLYSQSGDGSTRILRDFISWAAFLRPAASSGWCREPPVAYHDRGRRGVSPAAVQEKPHG